MKLTEFFLTEGEKDLANRERAHKCVQAIISHVKKHNADYVGQTDDGFAAGWMMHKFKGDRVVKLDLTELIFFIEIVEGNKNSWASYNKTEDLRDIITLYRGSPKKFTKEEDFAVFIAVEGPKFVEQSEEQLFHEVIHMLDSHRHQDQKYAQQPAYNSAGVRNREPKALKKYYNSPMELNAYAQQGMYRFTKEAEKLGIRTMEDLADQLQIYNSKDFIEFHMNMFPHHIVDRLSKQNKRHLIKRLMQYWYDVKDKLSG